MKGLENAINANISAHCRVKNCEKRGCKVLLPNKLAPFIVIDMDHAESPAKVDGKRCDFLFISEDGGNNWVVPLELKSGNVSSSEIVPQLQAGALVANQLVPKNAHVQFRPVAAYGGGLRKYEWYSFRKKRNKIKFRQHSEIARLIRCGSSLAKGFDNA